MVGEISSGPLMVVIEHLVETWELENKFPLDNGSLKLNKGTKENSKSLLSTNVK